MCGIVGFITKEKNLEAYDRRKFIEQALIVDTLRGYDGAGVFAAAHKVAKNSTTPTWAKVLGTGYGLTTHKKFKDIFENKTDEYKYVVGHNRSATMGGVILDATHPFQEGNITLVHNGTLENTGRLELSQYEAKAANDSHTICINLDKSEMEDVLCKLDGAFALVWHDARDDALRMIRNDKRPLHLAKALNRDTVYFASEAEMLHLLDMRLNLKMGPIQALKPMNLLTFHPGELVPEVKELKKIPVPVPKSTFQEPKHSPGYGNGYGGSVGHSWKSPSVVRGMGLAPEQFKSGIKTRPLPDIMKRMLWANGNTMSDKTYPFIPVKAEYIPWGFGYDTYTVYGYLEENIWGQGMSCMVHGILPKMWDTDRNLVWSIRPRGIRALDMGKEGPQACIVGTLINNMHPQLYRKETIPPNKFYGYPSMKFPFRAPEDYNKKEGSKSSIVLDNEEDVFLPGPHGTWISPVDWLIATSKGCIDCAQSITKDQAYALEWVNDRKDPMCPDCIERFSAPK